MGPDFTESTLPTWTSVFTAPTATSTSSLGAGDSPGRDDDEDALQRWSSLIGIITAIVGNVLIALALNVQRYAHTRLHKERKRLKQEARAALKRAHSSSSNGSTQVGVYGTIISDDTGDHYQNGRSSTNGNGHERGLYDDPSDDEHDFAEDEPLMASFQSSATTASSDTNTKSDKKPSSNYLKSPYWWLGQILITLGEAGNFLAYGFAPASIVSPLGVVALVSNCIIAPAMFHEKFRVRDFWGVVIAVSGVVTVVLSANQEETKLNPHDVWGAITTMEFEIYLGVTTFLIIVLMWASRIYGKRTILIDLGLVGLFGGYTALATKGVSSMLSTSFVGAFTTPVTYALIFILLSTAIMQIRYVNKALSRFDSTQVIPIQFVMFTLCVIIGSAVLYRDFEKTNKKQAAKFVGGCLLTFFGVFLITSGRDHRDDDEDMLSETDGIEETIGLMQHDGTASSSALPQPQHDQRRLSMPTPKTPSRRSSRMSRVSFADRVKSDSPHGALEPPSTHYFESAHSPAHLSGDEAHVLVNNPWQGLSGLGSTPVQPHPLSSFKEPQVTPSHSTDRPVTPRAAHITTAVKDVILRENDSPEATASSLRRIRSSIRASLFFNSDDEDALIPERIAEEPIIPYSDDNLPQALGHEDAGPSTDAKISRGRARSLSDTIGEFFRPKKQKKAEAAEEDEHLLDGDDEQQSSRSP
ncbi:magnesium transporter NIPA domain-containing protein [Trichoderma breve]|uniref:Magnesium transporter NIPA domain-containing protein n=1 Tax=Trichoderma breve TaxID=2034170 RepID=A0A9W9B3N4_9HYPO|nr:magnesium transporter NIPA domain-containing protein [Trichoderma breve]KAJ4855400.1 magnesium transporter NIPA domain-containing protein [Trichoderma breve]